jgi:SARP family transcriptional regulator, regulator of embCAB operon
MSDNTQPGAQEGMELSEADEELITLVGCGLTDDEIRMQLQIPQDRVLDHIARLLAKLGVRERLEIILYALSEPTMFQGTIAKIANRNAKNPQAHTPGMKQKAS